MIRMMSVCVKTNPVADACGITPAPMTLIPLDFLFEVYR